MNFLRSATLLALVLVCAGARAQTVVYSIDSTVVSSHRKTLEVSGGLSGTLDMDMSLLEKSLPKVLGNSDPLRMMRFLPGVSTGSEFDGGIHILGAENGHNDISIDGVPVYGVSHLLGLFSVFSPTHYGSMSFAQQASGARLGGEVTMHLQDTLCHRAGGDLTLGPMASQGTVCMPVGGKSALYLSARASMLNTFYSSWLKINNSQLAYGFKDFNATWLFQPGAKDMLWVDAYHGRDKAGMFTRQLVADLGFVWQNSLASLHWKHSGEGFSMEQVLYYSNYSSVLDLSQELVTGTMPAGITTAGYKCSVQTPVGPEGRFGADFDAASHRVIPQTPLLSVYEDGRTTPSQHGTEVSLAAHLGWPLGEAVALEAGARGHFYRSPEDRPFWGLSPYGKVSLDLFRFGTFGLQAGYRHQYIFQTGPTDIGFPTEYWLLTGELCEPQTSLYAILSYDLAFGRGMYSLSANAYAKSLDGQAEQRDIIFDIVDPSYSLADALLKGKGFNYGLNLMLSKNAGKFTGWLSYAWGRALRQFEGNAWSPSSHERLHELNLVGTMHCGEWDFGGTFIAASGAPYTPADYIYLESGVILAHFAGHNSGRLKPYVRLDLSATRELFAKNGQRLEANFSLFNALGRRNETGYRIRITDDSFEYTANSFMMRWMPSLSLNYKF